jgi:hypothetical protein
MAETKIVLKDGTEYLDGECGYSNRHLWCWLKNTNMVDAFTDFSDPEKTKEIRAYGINKVVIYYGFDTIDVIQKSEYELGKFSIDVRLTGENIYSEEHSIEDVTANGSD